MIIAIVIIAFIVSMTIIVLAFLYTVAKQHDAASRPGKDPRHDDVDEEALRKIRRK